MSSLSLARVCNFYCKRAPYLGVGQCFTVIEDTQIDKNKIKNESKTARLGFFEEHLQHFFVLKKRCNPDLAGPDWARLGWVGHTFFRNVKKG